MVTVSPLAESVMLRSRTERFTTSLICPRARRMKRWRLPRFLSFGFGRRSMKWGMVPRSPVSPGLVDAHVPLDQPTDLTFGVAAVHQSRDEFGVLAVRFAVLLAAEADDGQKVLDLAEHPLLDHVPKLFVTGPGRIPAFVLGPGTQGELDHLVAEVLRVRNTGRLLDLRELLIEDLAVEDLSRVRILVILFLDPGVRIGDVAVEQVLTIFGVGFEVGFLDLVADELGIAGRQLGLDEVQVLSLGLLRELLAPDRLLEYVHQVDRVRRDLFGIEVERLRQDLEGDRKSTRLNSSHVKISYAVLCLKE